MKGILRFFSNGWQILLLALLAITAVTGFAVGKYVSQQQMNDDFGVIAEGKPLLTVGKNGSGSYTVSNMDDANAPVFVRFTVVATWRTVNGNKLWATPTSLGVDYRVTTSNCQAIAEDGVTYYYFCGTGAQNGVLDVGEAFDFGIETLASKSGYVLNYEIVVEGVQCLPTSIAKNAWGVTYDVAKNKWVQVQ